MYLGKSKNDHLLYTCKELGQVTKKKFKAKTVLIVISEQVMSRV